MNRSGDRGSPRHTPFLEWKVSTGTSINMIEEVLEFMIIVVHFNHGAKGHVAENIHNSVVLYFVEGLFKI